MLFDEIIADRAKIKES